MADRIPTSRIARAHRLGRAVAREVLRDTGVRLSMVGRSEELRARLAEKQTLRAADQLFTILGGMKGAAMKVGQTMSLLDLDMFPESHRERFRERLADLCDQAPRMPFPQLRSVLEADLGPMREVFAEFDTEPLAAASIGQVYRARMRDGRAVAVKVQYPGIEEAVRADLENLRLFAAFWRPMLPALADSRVLEEVSLAITGELDYLAEARAQRHMAHRYRDHTLVHVPDVVAPLCTRRVLVSDLVDGRPFVTGAELPAPHRKRIAEIVYRFYVGSLYRDNEYCGDPHPGNVLLGADGRVAFVDFGLFHRMRPEYVRFEIDCVRAAVEGRAEDLRTLLVRRGVIDPTTPVPAEECLEYIAATAWWSLVDEEVTVTGDIATTAFARAVDPRADAVVQRVDNLPAEHLFSRRAELMTFGTIGSLTATNNWHRIAREWIYGDSPITAVGREFARHRAESPTDPPPGSGA
ncbi:AarF/ABC1/UbiB kinase family protein [Nocardia otitidiscaviarum]|uniref:AarF/ABC1/UbiB kinase family protein n=1 Tax=Nocardia otitidiscaviarum TaxID=1823 RepID=A0A516NLK0_9NOCA|nr:AarF/ABC1/UbiB kinase family protein [Nocardia otitidiscaviarum]MCP9624760.1 AarF/ABC1/UbiB kinase family protein [Nocardia otitidiscaviarum]QDP79769.1 AarF/ABC1/UbiB kinase family protein [Nocardia otitidiscaviarum]